MTKPSKTTMRRGRAKPRAGTGARKVSRKEVAEAAGVSVTTVTHALNPAPGVRVKPATAERVQRIARELGYRPNFVGQALVSGKTMAVGILLPSKGILAYQLHQDLMLGMAGAMEADDYHLLLLFRSEDHRYMNAINQGRVDGAFILQSDMATSHIERITDSGIPTVVVNFDWAPSPDVPVGCVRSDHEGMVRSAMDDFTALGCRTILFIIDPRWINANRIAHDTFLSEAGARAPAGVVGTVLVPYAENCRIQIRNALASGHRWDGILTDAHADAEVYVEEAQALGLLPGRDFHLITSDTMDGRTTKSRVEYRAYTQQPERVGDAAWRVLRGLIAGEPGVRTVRTPYRAIDCTDSANDTTANPCT